MSAGKTTLIEQGYRRTGAAAIIVDGVKFFAYSTGILRYARISEDGKCAVRRLYNRETYTAEIVGGGYLGKDGKAKRFRSELAAMKAGLAALRAQRSQSPQEGAGGVKHD